MYFYKGEKSVEGWEKFINGGYKQLEGENIPRKASSLGAFVREIKSIWKQLMIVVGEHPLHLVGIFTFVCVMVYISFIGVNWLNNKLEKMGNNDEKEKEGKAEGKTVEATDDKKKLKKE